VRFWPFRFAVLEGVTCERHIACIAELGENVDMSLPGLIAALSADSPLFAPDLRFLR